MLTAAGWLLWVRPVPAAAIALSSAAAFTLPWSPAIGTSLVPPPKKPVALHSEVLMWASELQYTAPKGVQDAASATALAAVPVGTGKTRTGASNTSARRVCNA